MQKAKRRTQVLDQKGDVGARNSGASPGRTWGTLLKKTHAP